MATVRIDSIFVDEPGEPGDDDYAANLRAECASRRGPDLGERVRARRLGIFNFNCNRLQDPGEWLECEVVKIEHRGGHSRLYHLRLLNREAVDSRWGSRQAQGGLFT